MAGALEVSNGRAVLVGNTTVTAQRPHGGDRSEPGRHGAGVCDQWIACDGGQERGRRRQAPLMLALDRGAIEVQMAATTRDVVMTPDLRFTMRSDGPLDLQLRVTRNGDTCVENRGAKAPVLNVADQFGEATYELQAGQHVLFEHGSLKEVVDHESSRAGARRSRRCRLPMRCCIRRTPEMRRRREAGGGAASLPCCGECGAGAGAGSSAGSCRRGAYAGFGGAELDEGADSHGGAEGGGKGGDECACTSCGAAPAAADSAMRLDRNRPSRSPSSCMSLGGSSSASLAGHECGCARASR